MVKLTASIFTFLTTYFCCKSQSFTINGQSSMASGSKIYLIKHFPVTPLEIDSILIVNNAFTFSKTGDLYPYKYSLAKDRNRPMFTFIWDGKVDIFLDSAHGENRHKITNSPLSKAYYDHHEKYFKRINDSIIQRSIKTAKLDRVRDSVVYLTLVSEQKELLEKQHAIAKEFIKKSPSSFLSLEFLDWLWPLLSGKEKRYYYDLIKQSKVKHPYKDIFERRLKDESEVSVGKKLDFSVISIDGQNIDLMKFRGKYVLIDFWGSWCGPCIRAIPELTKIYSEYRQTGKIEFLSISVEREKAGLAESKKIISDKGMNWIHVIQMESDLSEILKTYQVAAYPTQILLDKEGKIALYLVGSTKTNIRLLRDFLFRHLRRGY